MRINRSCDASAGRLDDAYRSLVNKKTLVQTKSLLKTQKVPVEFLEQKGRPVLKATIGSANSYSEIYLHVTAKAIPKNKCQLRFEAKYGSLYRILMTAIIATTAYLSGTQLFKLIANGVSGPAGIRGLLNIGMAVTVTGASAFIYMSMLGKYGKLLMNLYAEKMGIELHDVKADPTDVST